MKNKDSLYHDPDLVPLYDLLNAGRSDFDFYLSKLPTPPARVLDIGCGTGTFTIEMAQLGYEVFGIDPAPEMIRFARGKPESDNVNWQIGTVEALPKNSLIDIAIMTGHAFQCLLSDEAIAELFSSVSSQLSRNGRFLFESRNPAARPWERWQPEFAGPATSLPDGGTVQDVHELVSVQEEIVTFRECYKFSDGRPDKVSQSQLRFASKDRIIQLAENAGLTASNIWGNWDEALVGPEMIFELRKI